MTLLWGIYMEEIKLSIRPLISITCFMYRWLMNFCVSLKRKYSFVMIWLFIRRWIDSLPWEVGVRERSEDYVVTIGSRNLLCLCPQWNEDCVFFISEGLWRSECVVVCAIWRSFSYVYVSFKCWAQAQHHNFANRKDDRLKWARSARVWVGRLCWGCWDRGRIISNEPWE